MKSAMKIPSPRIPRDGPRWNPLDFRYHKSRMMLRPKKVRLPELLRDSVLSEPGGLYKGGVMVRSRSSAMRVR
jgi:hypothetical protein